MQLIIDNQLTVHGAPRQLIDELVGYFTLDNPAYAEAVKQGRYTHHIDRELCFAHHGAGGLILPRGAARDVLTIARNHNPVEIQDNRLSLPGIGIEFNGNLRAYQEQAVQGMLAKEFGVLEAGTGAGKTVMGLAIIAARKQPSLILVHTKELLYQWRDRVQQFLGIEAGLLGDGKGDIQPVTIGIVNTVKKHLPDWVVDECHRVPSTLFSEAATAFPAKYMAGLSATPYRRDGMGRLIGWFIGLHRVTVDMATLHEVGAVLRPKIITRETGFSYVYDDDYSKMVSALTEDQARNSLIAGDIRQQAGKGGLTLVVSDRLKHLKTLAEMAGVGAEILTGKTPAKQRRQIVEQLAGGDIRVLFSTLSLIGEGFDCPGMDALFLASPVKFSGRLKQVVGRVLRPAEGKEPLVFDYHDIRAGVLSHQWRSRQKEFQRMGAK
jgi:superfamily II DNA or RNA helicase